MSGQESKKHLGLKIIRKDIVTLQPVFGLHSFVEPGEIKFWFPSLRRLQDKNINSRFIYGGKINEKFLPITPRFQKDTSLW
jgi:hypothetical protein